MTSVDWDLLIIGRSYTGLSAALNLGRARRSVLVVGSGGARNDSVFHVHGRSPGTAKLPARSSRRRNGSWKSIRRSNSSMIA